MSLPYCDIDGVHPGRISRGLQKYDFEGQYPFNQRLYVIHIKQLLVKFYVIYCRISLTICTGVATRAGSEKNNIGSIDVVFGSQHGGEDAPTAHA